jgi:hypothetical protein
MVVTVIKSNDSMSQWIFLIWKYMMAPQALSQNKGKEKNTFYSWVNIVLSCTDTLHHLWVAILHKQPHIRNMETGCSTMTMNQLINLFWCRSVWPRTAILGYRPPYSTDQLSVPKNENPLELTISIQHTRWRGYENSTSGGHRKGLK